MINLAPNAFTAITWTDAAQAISDLPWVSLIVRAYGHNLATNSGFINYVQGNQFPSLRRFETGIDYLVFVSAPYALSEAVAAPAGAFPAFPGYNPVIVTPTAPVSSGAIPGTVNAQTAAVTIIGGTLVARVANGLIPYSTKSATEQRYLLFGFALNSALAGGTVQVQRNGIVTYPGLGLIPGATLLAGDNGRIVYSAEGMAIHHVIGRAVTDDSFSFSSSYTTIKISD